MNSNYLEPNQIFVYLGPTLSVTEATKILPARYFTPVRCGDILACLRLKPRVIAIIDGFFDRSAAVWHKEILWALEAGVRVFGASSMGALRAAELEVFGMKGYGDIFQAYREGSYISDDEVAILHSSAEFQYQPLTDALVNIRATVNYAVAKNIIDVAIANLIITCAKQRFFGQRSLAQAVADAETQGGEPKVLTQFLEFVRDGGYVDQKQLDAIGLLKHLATTDGQRNDTVVNERMHFKLSKTIFIEELQARVATRPLRTVYFWLPIAEKVSQEARFLGRIYIQLRNLAGLIRWCDAVAQQQNLQPLAVDKSTILGLDFCTNEVSNAKELDLDTLAMTALVERLGRIQALLKIYEGQDIFTKQVDKLHQFVLTIVDKDIPLVQEDSYSELLLSSLAHQLSLKLTQGNGDTEIQKDSNRSESTGDNTTTDGDIVDALATCELRLYRLVAILWALAEQTNSQSDVSLRSSIPERIKQHFLQERGINDEAEFQAWLASKPFSEKEFSQMIEAIARLEGFVNVPRWWGRGMSNYFSVAECFFPDALRLSGFYQILKKRVQLTEQTDQILSSQIQTEAWETELRKWCQINAFPQACNLTQVAFWLDFNSPEELVKELQARL